MEQCKKVFKIKQQFENIERYINYSRNNIQSVLIKVLDIKTMFTLG